MVLSLPSKLRTFSAAWLLLVSTFAFAQTTVFSDDFSTSAGIYYTNAPGPIGTSTKWTMARSGNDYGAGINNGALVITNDASGYANTSGWVTATSPTSAFAAPYSPTLALNPGVVTWTFNMRQPRTDPDGFLSGNYGSAFILAGTTGTTNVSGTGYAVVLGNSGKVDPIKLVRYSSGIRNFTTMISSSTAGLTDFGNQYLSIKVTYTPTTNTWQLFVRNDGATAFQDPDSGTLISQGTAVNSTYTSSTLGIMGGYWNASTATSQSARFGNVQVAVTLPSITSISPASKIAGATAFPLTVNGANFVNGTSTVMWNGSPRTTTYVSPIHLTAAITAADVLSPGTATVTVSNGTGISNPVSFNIDTAGAASLTVSTSALPAFSTIAGTASSISTYTISGINLTADPVITAPTNFEISYNALPYASSVQLLRTGTSLTGGTVTISVRVKSGVAAGIYSGNISNAAAGATTKLVSVSAKVLSTEPTTQASAISISAVTSTTFTVNCTAGNGSGRIIVVRSGSAVNSVPADGSSYSGNAAFASGSELGTGNFVVYAGSATSMTVTGLSPATAYHVAVFEYNGTGGTQNYNVTSAPTANRTTLNAPVGWQIYTANTPNTINFDTTVDGVTTDIFMADGISPSSSTGELNSNAWAISGFSDGAVAFGGTNPEDSDFDRGDSDGGESDGGVYAFNTSSTPTKNYGLGIQPAEGDFAPGNVTLRFQNQTGAPITSVSLGYKVYIYNDQPSSSNFTLSHSANATTFTNVSTVDVISPATADANPGWKAYYRVVTITGLNIATNNYYYLRWSSATVSGSVDFDEFALDDIVMVANPTSNFASFSGSAENFIVQGNTTLSGDASVASDLTLGNGKLDINGKTLILNGVVNNNVVGGLKGSAASNVIVTGTANPSLSFDQTIAGTTNVLNNFSVNTNLGSTVTILNPMLINGTLTTAANQTLNMGTNALAGTLSSIINNGTIATQNTTSLPIPAGRSWGGKIHLNAASASQTAVAGTFQNLTVATTGGAVAGGAITVNGILTLANNPSATTGSLTMGSYVLTMGGSATNAGTGDVTGVITRNSIVPLVLYTLGNTYTSIFFPDAGTLPTSMSLKVAIGVTPSWRSGAISRTYDFIQTGGSNTKAVIKAHYLDSELNGNLESKLVDWSHIESTNTTLEQGRSNYNTTENWVELTNVNVGLYFQPVFDAVHLTLDESEAESLTWNGSTSTSWTTTTNWTPNATPSDSTVVYIPDASTTPNDPSFNPLVVVGSVNIFPGGILNTPADAQITVNNGAGAWINNGVYNAGSGTSAVIFTNPDATIAGSTTFNNITINSGSGLRPLTESYIGVTGAFTNNGTLTAGIIDNMVEYLGTNQIVAVPNGSLTAYHNLKISGTGAVFPSTLNIRGNLTLDQPVDFTSKSIAMTGENLQTIAGTSAPIFNDLTINNSFGRVNMNLDASVNGVLTLTSGVLNLQNTTMTLGASAVAGSFDATHMIVASGTGELRRKFASSGTYLFPVGERTSTTEYSPISISIISGSFSNAYVGVSVFDAIHPDNHSTENNISRYWKVNQSGITGAVATVSPTFTAADVTGNPSDISGAQLNGTFDQQTNGWIKFTPVASNSFTATSATLTAGQTSVFTGLKGGTFTAALSGYGSFCEFEPVTLLATPIGGDGPFTYIWSGSLGTQQTANPSTATVGTTNYTVTIIDNNGLTATANADVVVITPSVGGTTTPNQVICPGSVPADISLSGYTGAVVHWQSSSDLNFTNPTNISNITNVLAGASIGPISETTYFRAVVANGSCGEVFSTAVAITVKSTTWDGSAWSNGVPDSATTAIIAGNFTASANLQACSMTIQNNAAVIIPSGFDVTLNGALSVSSGSFTLENNANLIQLTEAVNSGNILVKRNSSALLRQDYTLWSSPVDGQNLLSFSPLTVVSPTIRFYTYNTLTNLYNSVSSPSTTPFETGRGYLIRVPNNHPVSTPTIWTGQFSGVPHNGTITDFLADGGSGLRFNAIGNPYPSPISANSFVADNAGKITGALYFWRKTNNALSPSYCLWTAGGGFVSNGEAQVFDPQGVIQTGQGFFVEGTGADNAISFKNSQRIGDNAGQFFRFAEAERNRIWLNATNSAGAFSQMMVGYIEGATMEVDADIDGRYINDGAISLTTSISGADYSIEGRPLPFDPNDVVSLNFKAASAGSYSIAMDHKDGLFADGQQVYLRDNLTGNVHDLSSAYSFTSEAGTFAGRFDLLYQLPLSAGHPELNLNQVVVFNSNGKLHLNSGSLVMERVEVYDIRGRLLAQRNAVNSSTAEIEIGGAAQVLVVKIFTDDSVVVTRKAIQQ
ncbi:MAG: hypothetical protein EOO51_11035 [Flavobacterium sp.]|nr:MAG: hypothetical protein EOO51_11035 [Flavobacterium sp.]